jgi:hypothetical protein
LSSNLARLCVARATEVFEQLRNSETGQLRRSVGRDEDVGRFQIAVNDRTPMGVRHRVAIAAAPGQEQSCRRRPALGMR